MTAPDLEAIDRALLVISEARERAESAARECAEPRVVDALESADRALTSVYNDLWRAVYMPAAGDEQLRLAG